MSPAWAPVSHFLTVAAPYLAAAAVLFGLLGMLIGYLAHRRVHRLMAGAGTSIEDTIKDLLRHSRELQAFREDTARYLAHAEVRLRKSVRGVGMVRFNPFQGDGSGGNQSFSAAFLDEHRDGIVFSAIYARTTGATSIYAKPIEKGTSPFELTEEELEAIRAATERMHTPPVAKEDKK